MLLAPGPHDVDVDTVVLTGSDGASVPGAHARPYGMPTRGLVLHPDIGGVRPLFEEIARRLASHGYAVCCTEPFARVADRSALDVAARMNLMSGLDDAIQLGDLSAAADHLVVHDGVTDVAVLGFCMGGMYALKAAATERFDRAVSFYGMIRQPEPWRGPANHDALDTAERACPTLYICGDSDPFVPAEDVAALRGVWRDRDDCEIVVYSGADHGFAHDPDRPAHRPEDAADAWRRTLAFLA